MKFRVTVRSYNFATAEVSAPEGITDDNLREILFGMIEREELFWETDLAETLVVPLADDVPDEPAPADPTNLDFDGGSE